MSKYLVWDKDMKHSVTISAEDMDAAKREIYEWARWCEWGSGVEYVWIQVAMVLANGEPTAIERISVCVKPELSLNKDIAKAINQHNAEVESDTPDFVLANFLSDCLSAFNSATKSRTEWYEPKEASDV